ncbi:MULTISPECIES: flagella synthesis protein FlgN [Legionella]|uniref:Flagellar biosynthesis/type III secretory pathway chaperone n=1 Tax=Legionella drozanskii LLAP-1 TaxID=1212489 RepID=A0A0W0TBZ6_9GAMM|nr:MULTISPECIES: flagellar protein FlgN [Legionella]KTC93094.1 flagellar biosynthesis/type III secretory pathway chaperone [Legionella drozanskii LLAP-1]PJE11995.1 MAG: flagellar protein FlgN [Legionella sp.]
MTNSKITLLITQLKQEINWIDELIKRLSEEKKALAERQFTTLETIANQKETLSSQLEESANNRLQLLELPAYNNDTKLALQAFLKPCSLEEANQVNQLNNQLAEKIAECRELNSINGQVISSNINSRQDLISILTGQNPSNAINIYTATGDVKTSTASSCHEKA